MLHSHDYRRRLLNRLVRQHELPLCGLLLENDYYCCCCRFLRRSARMNDISYDVVVQRPSCRQPGSLSLYDAPSYLGVTQFSLVLIPRYAVKISVYTPIFRGELSIF